MRANVGLPEGLSLDKTIQENVLREHTYSDMFLEISSDEEDEQKDIEIEEKVEVDPILNIGGGVFYEGDLSQEHELHVAQEEVIISENISDEGEIENENVDAETEKDDDTPYLCSSQHSSDGTVSQECSQRSDPGIVHELHNIGTVL